MSTPLSASVLEQAARELTSMALWMHGIPAHYEYFAHTPAVQQSVSISKAVDLLRCGLVLHTIRSYGSRELLERIVPANSPSAWSYIASLATIPSSSA
jgi:hypothetical protein